MSQSEQDLFWSAPATAHVVERRVLFRAGKGLGQLTVSIAPDQPIPDLARCSDAMIKAMVVDLRRINSNQAIAPQLAFADIRQKTESAGPTILIGHRIEVPVTQLAAPTAATSDALDFSEHMKKAQAPMPTAAVAAGDHAIGFLFKTGKVEFYPLVTLNLAEDIEAFRNGYGSTADLLHLLPFQA